MIVTAGVVLWAGLLRPVPPSPPITLNRPKTPPEPLPTEPISFEGVFAKGNPSAKVAILEYADLQCSACARFAKETFAQILAAYVDTGRIQFGFRNFPLPSHPFAKKAAIGAHCAGEQGKFWEMYEILYSLPSRLDEARLRQLTKSLSIDAASWSVCTNTTGPAIVQRDFDEAHRLRLTGTPTFLIGVIAGDGQMKATSRLYGARPLADFDAAISDAEKLVVRTR